MKSSLTGKLTFALVEPDTGLAHAVTMSPPGIVDELRRSGLRGRGGGGFEVAEKWRLCAAAEGPGRFIVCNAAEGEPGSFKDRAILQGFAQLVFEGMTIAAAAVGASRGILYLRREYGYMAAHMESVLAARRHAGLLGQCIPGRGDFDFDISIHLGDGAYVCGQETALLEYLEGRRGEPRNRPPWPTTRGLRGAPTVVHNVETFAWVSCVLARGAAWFKNLGTAGSPGLKLFSVSGDCQRPGVYEFQLGFSISELLETVGAERVKGVQIGGASGRMIPPSQFHRTIAMEDLPYGGAIIVFGEERDMLDVAGNYLRFFVRESCGQCVPCREGTRRLLDGVERLRQGRCPAVHLDRLCELGNTIRLTSKCGLGQSAPQAFLSIVSHYRRELMGRERHERG